MKVLWTLLINICLCGSVFAQMSQGVITYERTINLWKKYKYYSDIKKWFPEKDKYRKDVFELHFNDTVSVFLPTIEEMNNSWTANCNTVTNYYNRNWTESKLYYGSDQILVQDSLIRHKWKITDKWRKIADYDCRQAVFQFDDTLRIYAWFTTAVQPSVGPESYWDLPGAILGLATEDGSITYFATKVESKPLDWINIKQRFNTKKARSREEVKTLLGDKLPNKEKDTEYSKYLKQAIRDVFLW